MKEYSKVIVFLFFLMSVNPQDQKKDQDEDFDYEDQQFKDYKEENEIPPKGHMEPIGNSGISWVVEETSNYPDPVTFYKDYVVPSKPIIFRGMAKKYPSYTNLLNDGYLKENYGKWKVFFEKGKKEDKKQNGMEASFFWFLDNYQKKNIYMVSDVVKPNPLTNDFYIPKPLLCDDITKRISTSILWFSSGGTKSLLHTDSQENLNCVIDGYKEFIMVPRRQRNVLPLERVGAYSKVDVEKVNLYKYPSLSRVSWYKAKLNPGDCLYIPYLWAHHVHSTGKRNMAVNLWWSHLLQLPNKNKCINKTMKDHEQWSKFDINTDGFVAQLMQDFEGEKEPLNVDIFHNVIFDSLEKVKTFNDSFNLFKKLDSNMDGLLHYKEIYNSNIDQWKPYFDKNKEEVSGVLKYEEVNNGRDEL